MNLRGIQESVGSRMTRRGFVQVGYSGLLGMSLPGLLAARAGAAGLAGAGTTGKAKSVIVILLSGGLGQHDSFDMKPEAPDTIRGEFKPIQTAVPGVHFCEHLPRLAARADQLAVVRSMSHPEGNHLVAVHHVLTGRPSNPRGASDLDRVASRDDFPCYGAVLNHVRSRNDGVPNGVSLPLRLVEGPLTWPGQDAGFLGPRNDPWQLRLDPNRPEVRDDSLTLPEGLDSQRLHLRRHLLGQTSVSGPNDPFLDQQDAALAMLCNGKVGTALDVDREDPRLADRYGKHVFGRSLLIARRLVEIGVPVIQATMGIVQTWDTHVSNFPRLKDELLPALDRAVSALLDDLRLRGLLDETLVVMLGEFGRTPRVHELTPGAVPGRDHWPAVFPAVFAGAGVVGGQMIGRSDKIGAYAVTKTFGPPDLAATVYKALGVDPATEIRDRLGRPLAICTGDVIDPLYSAVDV
ncbi:MAG: DUF1501 domain-containing protein [Paludisphaera borealis]|uniref:DUF1501 domain-containing protein n=1 Tax=Paludisphaera borealis TaxID=1387353 RepID=UPI00284088EB|nr:DUF1501 domain-containing protein [Paludisphaera borealis]MDR3621457.1 DUF1501 domain-containing protein [Paludisphaera borealis]